MGDAYFAEKIDAEMKTFPWSYPEQYILSDFIPSPCNFPVEFDGPSLKIEGTETLDPDSRQSQRQEEIVQYSPDPPENLMIDVPTDEAAEDFPEFIEPLTPLSPRFPPHALMNLSPPHVTSPSTNEFRGDYNFRMVLETQPKKVANPDWIYSVHQKKLYIKSKTPCPVRFLTTGPPPSGAFIRAMPVFRQPEHAKDVVRCCRNHTAEHTGSPATGHFLRCDNQEAEYEECPQTTRHSVRIPLRGPASAEDADELGVHELFYFICNNSCGGLNRRPIQIIFTLEDLSGSVVLGRCYVNVRVCACPGRDSKQEIEAINRGPGKKPRGKSKASVNDLQCLGPKMSKEDSTVYNLKICGFNNYLMMKRIAIALELFANMENKFTTIEPHDLEMPDLTEYSPEDQDNTEPDSTLVKPSVSESPTLPLIANQESFLVPSHAENWYQAVPQDQASQAHQPPQYPQQCFTYRRKTSVIIFRNGRTNL